VSTPVLGRAAALVLAGGSGERFGEPGGKQLLRVAGLPILAWSVAALEAAPGVGLVIIACPRDRFDEYVEQAIVPIGCATPVVLVPSGETRQASLAAALAEVPSDLDIVAVHDGARPLVTAELVEAAIDALRADARLDGVVVGHPSVDTIKSVDAHQVIQGTPDRVGMWLVQTPQVFRTGVLRSALEAAELEGFIGTDDSSLVERIGGRVRMLEGPRDNIKVTLAEDLLIVDALLTSREGE
jgi:2-C-methyl-D-erythritol 4-phosphate cytidylyltransferase